MTYVWACERKMRLIAIFAMVAALAGCAQTRWYKDGATEADFNADKSFCEYESIKYAGGYDNSYRSAFGSSLDMAMRRNEIATACMGQRGWQAKRE